MRVIYASSVRSPGRVNKALDPCPFANGTINGIFRGAWTLDVTTQTPIRFRRATFDELGQIATCVGIGQARGESSFAVETGSRRQGRPASRRERRRSTVPSEEALAWNGTARPAGRSLHLIHSSG